MSSRLDQLMAAAARGERAALDKLRSPYSGYSSRGMQPITAKAIAAGERVLAREERERQRAERERQRAEREQQKAIAAAEREQQRANKEAGKQYEREAIAWYTDRNGNHIPITAPSGAPARQWSKGGVVFDPVTGKPYAKDDQGKLTELDADEDGKTVKKDGHVYKVLPGMKWKWVGYDKNHKTPQDRTFDAGLAEKTRDIKQRVQDANGELSLLNKDIASDRAQIRDLGRKINDAKKLGGSQEEVARLQGEKQQIEGKLAAKLNQQAQAELDAYKARAEYKDARNKADAARKSYYDDKSKLYYDENSLPNTDRKPEATGGLSSYFSEYAKELASTALGVEPITPMNVDLMEIYAEHSKKWDSAMGAAVEKSVTDWAAKDLGGAQYVNPWNRNSWVSQWERARTSGDVARLSADAPIRLPESVRKATGLEYAPAGWFTQEAFERQTTAKLAGQNSIQAPAGYKLENGTLYSVEDPMKFWGVTVKGGSTKAVGQVKFDQYGVPFLEMDPLAGGSPSFASKQFYRGMPEYTAMPKWFEEGGAPKIGDQVVPEVRKEAQAAWAKNAEAAWQSRRWDAEQVRDTLDKWQMANDRQRADLIAQMDPRQADMRPEDRRLDTQWLYRQGQLSAQDARLFSNTAYGTNPDFASLPDAFDQWSKNSPDKAAQEFRNQQGKLSGAIKTASSNLGLWDKVILNLASLTPGGQLVLGEAERIASANTYKARDAFMSQYYQETARKTDFNLPAFVAARDKMLGDESYVGWAKNALNNTMQNAFGSSGGMLYGGARLGLDMLGDAAQWALGTRLGLDTMSDQERSIVRAQSQQSWQNAIRAAKDRMPSNIGEALLMGTPAAYVFNLGGVRDKVWSGEKGGALNRSVNEYLAYLDSGRSDETELRRLAGNLKSSAQAYHALKGDYWTRRMDYENDPLDKRSAMNQYAAAYMQTMSPSYRSAFVGAALNSQFEQKIQQAASDYASGNGEISESSFFGPFRQGFRGGQVAPVTEMIVEFASDFIGATPARLLTLGKWLSTAERAGLALNRVGRAMTNLEKASLSFTKFGKIERAIGTELTAGQRLWNSAVDMSKMGFSSMASEGAEEWIAAFGESGATMGDAFVQGLQGAIGGVGMSAVHAPIGAVTGTIQASRWQAAQTKALKQYVADYNTRYAETPITFDQAKQAQGYQNAPLIRQLTAQNSALVAEDLRLSKELSSLPQTVGMPGRNGTPVMGANPRIAEIIGERETIRQQIAANMLDVFAMGEGSLRAVQEINGAPVGIKEVVDAAVRSVSGTPLSPAQEQTLMAAGAYVRGDKMILPDALVAQMEQAAPTTAKIFFNKPEAEQLAEADAAAQTQTQATPPPLPAADQTQAAPKPAKAPKAEKPAAEKPAKAPKQPKQTQPAQPAAGNTYTFTATYTPRGSARPVTVTQKVQAATSEEAQAKQSRWVAAIQGKLADGPVQVGPVQSEGGASVAPEQGQGAQTPQPQPTPADPAVFEAKPTAQSVVQMAQAAAPHLFNNPALPQVIVTKRIYVDGKMSNPITDEQYRQLTPEQRKAYRPLPNGGMAAWPGNATTPAAIFIDQSTLAAGMAPLSPQDRQAKLRAISREEMVHIATASVRTPEQLREDWARLPDEVKQRVIEAYYPASVLKAAGQDWRNVEVDPQVMALEFWRMYLSAKLDGVTTEQVAFARDVDALAAADPTFAERIAALLKDLATWLREQLMGSLDDQTRAEFEDVAGKIEAELARMEAASGQSAQTPAEAPAPAPKVATPKEAKKAPTKAAKAPQSVEMPQGWSQAKLRLVRAQLKVAQDYGVEVSGLAERIGNVEQGQPDSFKEILDGLNLAMADSQRAAKAPKPAAAERIDAVITQSQKDVENHPELNSAEDFDAWLVSNRLRTIEYMGKDGRGWLAPEQSFEIPSTLDDAIRDGLVANTPLHRQIADQARQESLNKKLKKRPATDKAEAILQPIRDKWNKEYKDKSDYNSRVIYNKDNFLHALLSEQALVDGKPILAANVQKYKLQSLVENNGYVLRGRFYVRAANVAAERIDEAPTPQTKQPSKWRPIGQNGNGQPLFEDDAGIRSFLDGEFRITEPVRLTPRGETIASVSRRGSEFSTAEELGAETQPFTPQTEEQRKAAELEAALNDFAQFLPAAPAEGPKLAAASSGAMDFSTDPQWRDVAYSQPTPEAISRLKLWLRDNPDAVVRMYHGTDARNPISKQGLLPTGQRRRHSLQSRTGYVSLSIYPGMARRFGEMAYPEREISVYAVDVPVRMLIADTDQLSNKRLWGTQSDRIGGTLADSIAFGHGAQVKGRIEPRFITPFVESPKLAAASPSASGPEFIAAATRLMDALWANKLRSPEALAVALNNQYPGRISTKLLWQIWANGRETKPEVAVDWAAVLSTAQGSKYHNPEYIYLGTAPENWQESQVPEAGIVNPIDPNLTPDEKVDALNALSDENVPLVEKIIGELLDKVGLEGKWSKKLPERILAKASRPQIRAKKAWHDVEHIRDGLRFKVKLDSFEKIADIFPILRDNGVELVKLDTAKMFAPLEWGWRFLGFDLRMPNGQLVEFYAPVPELDADAVKDPNHVLFEKWRNATDSEIANGIDQYKADVKTSRDRYDAAFSAALKRMGYASESAAESDFNKAVERGASVMGAQPDMGAINSPRVVASELGSGPQGPSPSLENSPLPVPKATTKPGESSDSNRSAFETVTTDNTNRGQNRQPEVAERNDKTEISEKQINEAYTAADRRALEEAKDLRKKGQAASTMSIDMAMNSPLRAEQLEREANQAFDQANELEQRVRLGAIARITGKPVVETNDKDRLTNEAPDSISNGEQNDDRKPAQSDQGTTADGAGQGDAGGAEQPSSVSGVGSLSRSVAEQRAAELNSGVDGGTAGGTDAVSGQQNVESDSDGVVNGGSSGDSSAAISGTGSGRGKRGRGRNAADGAGTQAGVEPASARVERPPVGSPERNHVIAPDAELSPRGIKSKLRANLRAIAIIKALESEGRLATAEEKDELAKFSGWGAIPQVFDDEKADQIARGAIERLIKQEETYRDGYGGSQYYTDLAQMYADERKTLENWRDQWGKAHDEIKNLLTDEEYRAAKRSTINAHYTSPEIITPMWDILRWLGFRGGNVLEPGAGIGHFFGLMPQDLADQSKLFGIELDSYTAKILKALYPEADIQNEAFQRADIADGSMDVAISNVPFANVPVSDPAIEAMGGPTSNLHDYFFGKALTKLKPGGIQIFITSAFTMDKGNSEIRKWLAERADLIAAFRLPNNAFKANAGTDVVTDIIILRKKDGNPFPGAQDWTQLDEATTRKGEKIRINQYFAAHPQNILGLLDNDGTMFAKGEEGEMTVHGDPNNPPSVALQQALALLPKDVFGADSATTQARTYASEVKMGNIIEKDGKYYFQGQAEPDAELNAPKNKARVKLFVAARDALNKQYDLELSEDATDEEIEANRKELNKAYDAFVAKFNNLHDKGNRALFVTDPDYYRLAGAEVEKSRDQNVAATVDDLVKRYKGKTKQEYVKADIFKKRVMAPRSEPKSADNIEDAYGISLGWRGRVDVPFMSQLTGKSIDQVERELVEREIALRDPETGQLVSREQYISGNVRRKLEVAKAAGDAYSRNVNVLEGAQPPRVPIGEVLFEIGASWIPPEVFSKFLASIGIRDVTISYSVPKSGQGSPVWSVDTKRARYVGRAWEDFQTIERNTTELMDALLNARNIVVYQKGEKGLKVDAAATEAAKSAATKINESFVAWAKNDPDVSAQLEETYNKEVNAYAQRTYDGQFLTFPWANKDFDIYPDKKNTIWRAIQEGLGLIAHGVGGGKTIIGSAIALEMRRLGMARKPMIVVHNSTLEGFANEIAKLAPTSRVLIGREDELQGSKRKEFLMRIAAGDWDAVIIAHSTFDLIEDDPQYIEKHINQLIDEITDALKDEGFSSLEAAKKKKGTTRTVKQLVKAQERLEEQLRKNSERKVDTGLLTFQQLGIDALIVDEVHKFKKMPFVTQRTAKGIDGTFSKRGYALMMRARYIQEKMGGRNVFGMTGTPVTNTLGEIWNMVRLVAPNLLRDAKIEYFDQWVSKFGNITVEPEMGPTGDFKMVERLSKMKNMPEWNVLLRQAADVKLGDDLVVKNRPQIRGGQPELIAIPRSKGVSKWIAYIRQVLEAYEKLGGKDFADNPSLMAVPVQSYMASKAAAIDIRLVEPRAKDDPGSKVNTMIDKLMEVYNATSKYNGTQVIFADSFNTVKTSLFDKVVSLGNLKIEVDPKQPEGTTFNLYEDIRQKLIARGIPAQKIAVITDSKWNSKANREKLFKLVNEGQVRVIIGSTEKLGTGVNMQKLMAAAHNLDVPWTPAELEQRDGRVYRQGNIHGEMGIPIDIFRYGMKNTLDAALWQKLQTKQVATLMALSGKVLGREFELAPEGMTLGEQMAVLSGPHGRRMFAIQMRLLQLKAAREGFESQARARQLKIEAGRRGLASELSKQEDIAPIIEQMRQLAQSVAKDGIVITVGGKSFKTKTETLEAIKARIDANESELTVQSRPETSPQVLGITVNGRDIALSPYSINTVTLDDGMSKTYASYALTTPAAEPELQAYFGNVHSGPTLFSRLEELGETVNTFEANQKSGIKRLEEVANLSPLTEFPQQAEFDALLAELEQVRALAEEERKQADAEALADEQDDENFGPTIAASRAIPQSDQAMPDVAPQWESYAESLRDDVESWSPARDTGRIDYEMMDVVDSFVNFARRNPQMAGSELTAAFYNDAKPTALQRKKLNAAIANVGEPPRAAARDAGPTIAAARPLITPEDMDADMDEQAQWMVDQSRLRGYESVDELLASDPEAFQGLAAVWRDAHPRAVGSVAQGAEDRGSAEERARIEVLVTDNLGLATALAQRFNIPRLGMEDKVQEARVGLLTAAQSFDEGRGVPFGAYATRVIRNRMSSLYRQQQRMAGAEVQELDAPVGEMDGETGQSMLADRFENAPATADTAAVREIMDSLPARPRRIWEAVMAGRSMEDIGQEEGVTKQAISKLLKATQNTLRAQLAKRGIRSVDDVFAQKNPFETGRIEGPRAELEDEAAAIAAARPSVEAELAQIQEERQKAQDFRKESERPKIPEGNTLNDAKELYHNWLRGRLDKVEFYAPGAKAIILDDKRNESLVAATINSMMQQIRDDITRAFGYPKFWSKHKKRLQNFLDELLPVAARLEVERIDDNGEFVFKPFLMRAGTINASKVRANGFKVGDMIPTDKGAFELGPEIENGRYLLLKSMPAAVQQQIYEDFHARYPESAHYLDRWIMPGMEEARYMGPQGTMTAEFNRYALRDLFNEWPQELRDLFGALPFPDMPYVEGYTPDVAEAKTLASMIGSLLRRFKSGARKMKAGEARESGNIKNLFEGFSIRAMEAHREKIRVLTRQRLIEAAATPANAIPREELVKHYVELDQTFRKLLDAVKLARRLNPKSYPHLTAALSPEDERAMAKILGDAFRLRGRGLMIRKEVETELMLGAARQITNNIMLKILGGLIERFNAGVLATGQTVINNLLSNEIFKFTRAANRLFYALLSISTGDVRGAKISGYEMIYLLRGFLTDRFTGSKFQKNRIGSMIPRELFNDNTGLEAMEIDPNISIKQELLRVNVGGAFLKLVRYGDIDAAQKQQMAYAAYRAHAQVAWNEAKRRGEVSNDTDRRQWQRDWVANAPSELHRDIYTTTVLYLMDYQNVPAWMDPQQSMNSVVQVIKRFAIPFTKWPYNMARQFKRLTFDAALDTVMAGRSKQQRIEGMANLMTMGALAAVGAAISMGDDDPDDPLLGASVDEEGRYLDAAFRTKNRINVSRLARIIFAHGLMHDVEFTLEDGSGASKDLYWRYRSYPYLKEGIAIGLLLTGKTAEGLEQLWDVSEEYVSLGLLSKFLGVSDFDKGKPVGFRIAEGLYDVATAGIVPPRIREFATTMIDPVYRRKKKSEALGYEANPLDAIRANTPFLSKTVPVTGTNENMPFVPFSADKWFRNERRTIEQTGLSPQDKQEKIEALRQQAEKMNMSPAQQQEFMRLAGLPVDKFDMTKATSIPTITNLERLRSLGVGPESYRVITKFDKRGNASTVLVAPKASAIGYQKRGLQALRFFGGVNLMAVPRGRPQLAE